MHILHGFANRSLKCNSQLIDLNNKFTQFQHETIIRKTAGTFFSVMTQSIRFFSFLFSIFEIWFQCLSTDGSRITWSCARSQSLEQQVRWRTVSISIVIMLNEAERWITCLRCNLSMIMVRTWGGRWTLVRLCLHTKCNIRSMANVTKNSVFKNFISFD